MLQKLLSQLLIGFAASGVPSADDLPVRGARGEGLPGLGSNAVRDGVHGFFRHYTEPCQLAPGDGDQTGGGFPDFVLPGNIRRAFALLVDQRAQARPHRFHIIGGQLYPREYLRHRLQQIVPVAFRHPDMAGVPVKHRIGGADICFFAPWNHKNHPPVRRIEISRLLHRQLALAYNQMDTLGQ
ncbi:hypothetical protein D3C75_975450 [compost metagenome]